MPCEAFAFRAWVIPFVCTCLFVEMRQHLEILVVAVVRGEAVIIIIAVAITIIVVTGLRGVEWGWRRWRGSMFERDGLGAGVLDAYGGHGELDFNLRDDGLVESR